MYKFVSSLTKFEMMKLPEKCPTCGLEMKARVVDPIFQKKEYYCEVCDLARKISRSKHEERKQEDMILQEINRWWDLNLDEKGNYERFCKFSKLKLTSKKYHQILENQK